MAALKDPVERSTQLVEYDDLGLLKRVRTAVNKKKRKSGNWRRRARKTHISYPGKECSPITTIDGGLSD
jgi:hypothetical protein